MCSKHLVPVLLLWRVATLKGSMLFYFPPLTSLSFSFHSTGERFSQNLILEHMELKSLLDHSEYHNNP